MTDYYQQNVIKKYRVGVFNYVGFDVQPCLDELRHIAWNVLPVRLQHRGVESASRGKLCLIDLHCNLIVMFIKLSPVNGSH